ncbi:dihydrolipoyl dehydrogenase [Oscillibacter sp. 1-3]|uniref:dihydrolipoyl dehydrogenase n=1 Tax=Oscillibacter sp. 1-3 TaxID=1235797 RepID=UPI000334AFD6|nr:dihydrolipoyl dehydrogenase [Oscillibacter sp. 1-3]EOS67674.1 dihydrolipoyl dehydrogenase [Oscillibacter sp. 1-3]
MAFEVKMPQLGLTMEEGTVSKWIKHEGDAVKVGDVILEITTDKLTNEVASEAEGTLLKIVAQEGEDVPVKGTLAWIGQPGEAIGGAPAPAAPAVPFAPAPAAAAATAAPAAPAKPAGDTSVIVIGGGPGGYVAAIRAAQLGAKVTVIEKQYLGGTCLNVGCIPTKCLLHSAELVEDIKNQGKEIGVEVEGVKVNFPQVIAHKNDISKKLTSGVAGLLKMNKVKKIDGEASFVGEKKISVKKPDGSAEEMTADAIIVATGSVNSVPPIPGIKENPNCIDSTGALSLEALPKSMVVIGGGVIGLELACAYAAFGTKITVVEAMDHMLPMLDGDLTKIGVAHMKKMGMEFNLECPVQSVESSPAGAKVVCKNKAGETVSFEAEKVLVAIGRKANTASLNLEAGKIANDRGRIIVNDKMETNIPGVYAIGDCVMGRAQLAHTASAMGEVAAENICGHEAYYDEKTNPTCVYIEPEAASVGLTEEQCKAQGIEYKVGKFPMSANGKALIINGGEGLVKIIAGKEYGEILGMHIIGPRATDLIAEGALAIGEEMTLDEIIATIHSHPTVTETMREAALQAEKRAIHTSNK